MSDRAPRWGLSAELPGLGLPEHQPVLEAAERAGFTDVWSGEVDGHDGFTVLALAAAWTEQMRLGTGVVNVFTRGRAVLAQHAAALQAASSGRFALGLGTTTPVIASDWNDVTFAQPRERLLRTVEFLRRTLAGSRTPGGFRLAEPPSQRVPIMVAALRERMLKTAAAIGDGVFLNLAPLSETPRLMEAIAAGAEEAGRSIVDLEVLCRIPCVPATDANAEDLARQLLTAYATVPVYHDYFAWLGYGEALAPVVEAWQKRDRLRATQALPHELVGEIFAFGTADEQRTHVEKMIEAGITCPVLMPILPNPSISSYIKWIESMSHGRS